LALAINLWFHNKYVKNILALRQKYFQLKGIGIKGYYTWIYGGYSERFISKDFTSDEFKHIVVCVPNGKETLWME
jgi:hypothetical protein